MSNYNFIICAVFKNEAHILEEWIKHYLNRGCDHLYLVNDDSTDDFLDICLKYENSVTIYNNEIFTSKEKEGRRLAIYNKYFKPLLSESKWMAILDLSDFLYSPDTLVLPDIIEKYEDYSQIVIDCLIFGSNGLKSQPLSVVDEFIKCGLAKEEGSECNKRTIVKCAELIELKKYEQEVSGDTFYIKNVENGQISDLVINNYCVQSLQWFLKVKAIRGSLDNVCENIKMTHFTENDRNEKLDTRLSDQNKLIKRAVKSLRTFKAFGDLIEDWATE
jgi:hypothetical protein